MNFSFSSGPDAQGARPGGLDGDRPFRILVIADYSGRTGRGVAEPLAARPVCPVDLDSFDALPGRLGTSVRVRNDPPHDIPIASIDDLHPDAIHDRAELFKALRDLRSRLNDPATFKAAAEEVARLAPGASPTHSEIEPKPAATATPESEFTAMLGRSVGNAPARSAASVESLLRQIIGPSIVPDRDPQQDQLLALVDGAIAGEMRSVLHALEWRRTEAAWRCLHSLVTGLELGQDLRLFALDASPAELVSDSASLEEALISRPARTAGGEPWALIVHIHEHDADSSEGLAGLARLAHLAGAVLVSSAAPSLVGRSGWSDTSGGVASPALASLARDPAAAALCLTAPRVLARLPYAPGYDETERMDFDETGGDAAPEDLLWSPGASLVALMLGRAFAAAGWELRPVGGGVVDDLPVVTSRSPDTGETGMIPCAEAWLNDRQAEALARLGLTPLVSVQNRGAVHISPLRAVSGGPLACRW